MPVHGIDPFKVLDIKALQNLQQSVQAEELMRKVATQVQPILRKRQLRVPLLSEFYPHKPNLLGLNIGGGRGNTHEIRLRLRQPHSKGEFLPFESVLGTMLHELCHNHIGPHNQSFYALLDELRKECEDLMARGIQGTGAGFDAASEGRIGGRWRNPSDAERRLAVLQAAERRQKASTILGGLMPRGPQKLGGFTVAATPSEAAANAAMQRARDAEACGCDEAHGTQVSFDDRSGEVVPLKPDLTRAEQASPHQEHPLLNHQQQASEHTASGERTGDASHQRSRKDRPNVPSRGVYMEDAGPLKGLRESTKRKGLDASSDTHTVRCKQSLRTRPSSVLSDIIDLTGEDNDNKPEQ